MTSALTTAPASRPDAEPFYYPGGPVGVLLIHGYTGTPAELRPLGQHLAQAGYSVGGLLLAHHGGTPDTLHNVGWQAWTDSAQQEFLHFRRQHHQVVLAGFSMGALIALYLAARYPPDALILMAPALRLRNEGRLALAGIAKYVLPWLYPLQKADFNDPQVRANILSFCPDANLDDPELVAQLRREVRISIKSIYELVKLKRVAARCLPRVSAPVLIMQGERDETVDPISATLALNGIASTDKELVMFPESSHQLPRVAGHEQVLETAARWLQQRLPVAAI